MQDGIIRVELADSLGYFASATNRIQPVLESGLSDPDVDVAMSCARSLARLGTDIEKIRDLPLRHLPHACEHLVPGLGPGLSSVHVGGRSFFV